MPHDCPLVGVELDDRSIPIENFAHPKRVVYLLGAEDHGLIATFPPGVEVPEPFEVVGRVVPAPGEVLIDGRGIDAEGWDPYSGWDGRSG